MSVSEEQDIELESLACEYIAKERTKDRDLCPREYRTRGNELVAVASPGEVLRSYHKEQIATEFHVFMNLPAEVRIMIYKCCLTKGTIFVPRGAFTSRVKYKKKYTMDAQIPPTQTERYRGVPKDWGALYATKKHIGLICGVSRQVQTEALPVFYGQNRFVLPYGYWVIPNILDTPGTLTTPHGQIGNCMRDISVAFDSRDDEAATRSAPLCPPDTDDGHGNVVDQEKFLRDAHDERVARVGYMWRRRIWHLQAMRLDRVRLCFRECKCPMGCCRLVGMALEELEGSSSSCFSRPGRWKFSFPREVEVTGWRGEGERVRIEEALRRTFRGDVPVEITFVEDEGDV
ncbi:hypothetical protein F4820DRAFT_452629 [Hypoxylon rubiginosum]|uniref:Uncharacterized protein n=1 Tax=Hypoxylon rubiginosum TaxID=110542 RepID=A0ACB9YMV8_9PEZI|nr:hypothetical protein F4820DRAFT_452629 [Hypoxylon rubiginosum]